MITSCQGSTGLALGGSTEGPISTSKEVGKEIHTGDNTQCIYQIVADQ